MRLKIVVLSKVLNAVTVRCSINLTYQLLKIKFLLSAREFILGDEFSRRLLSNVAFYIIQCILLTSLSFFFFFWKWEREVKLSFRYRQFQFPTSVPFSYYQVPLSIKGQSNCFKPKFTLTDMKAMSASRLPLHQIHNHWARNLRHRRYDFRSISSHRPPTLTSRKLERHIDSCDPDTGQPYFVRDSDRIPWRWKHMVRRSTQTWNRRETTNRCMKLYIRNSTPWSPLNSRASTGRFSTWRIKWLRINELRVIIFAPGSWDTSQRMVEWFGFSWSGFEMHDMRVLRI